jgi:hypothetical protein
MPVEAPPIVKLTERLLAEVELAVIRFPRFHRYASGADLRRDARAVASIAIRAWRDQHQRADRLVELVHAVDELKLSLQLSKRVEAFRSFAQFEALARLVSDLGRQCGGWQKKHSKSQNRASDPSSGRATTLSARGASREAQL